MRASLLRDWERLASENALGAILTGNAGALRAWSPEEFFATGRADARAYLDRLQCVAPDGPRQRVLDFGCGVGRISRALVEFIPEVVGVDVSPTMVSRARAFNDDRPGCRFVVNRADDLRLFDTASFDLVYCRLVLQHLPRSLVTRYIPEMLRVLAPGGVLMFQLPERIDPDSERAFVSAPVTGARLKRALPRRLVDVYRRVKYRVIARWRSRIDGVPGLVRMFGMDRDDVLRLVADADGIVLAIDDDHAHGTSERGYAYWVTC